MLFFLLTFFCFGLIFGSFSTVLIERWHSGKWGILMGRSECQNCHTTLWTPDLVPIFSYLFSQGKCRYCRSHISIFYPIAELTMGCIFMILAYAAIATWIDPLWLKMFLLLVFGFVTGVYVLYDIRYMEIPDQVMVPILYLLLWIPFLSLLFTGYSEYPFHTFHITIGNRLAAAAILYTFFYLQILIPGGFFLLKKRDWKHFMELLASYVIFPFTILTDMLRKKKDDSNIEIPVWIGWGDLRIALFIGLTLGVLHGVASFAIAYIIGSIVWIFILLLNYIRWKKTESQIPFGPFLGFGWLMSIVLYSQIELIHSIYFY